MRTRTIQQSTGEGSPSLRFAFFVVTGALLLAATVLIARAEEPIASQTGWRVKIREAAVVQGGVVLLGEIADVLGADPKGEWEQMARTELWPSPPGDKPMIIGKSKLREALEYYMGDAVNLCILPSSLVLQQGGKVFQRDDMARLVAESLSPQAAAMQVALGQGNRQVDIELREYRLPAYVFLRDSTSDLAVELVSGTLQAGRNSLYFRERFLDGSEGRTLTGSVFVDVWTTVPAAARPLNRGEEVTPKDVTYVRKNLAYLEGEVWDALGGPRRIIAPVGMSQVLYEKNLETLPMVKRGDAVQLVFQGTNIRLEVPAEALADGGYGESIPVRNLESKREVYARVQDAVTVTVQ